EGQVKGDIVCEGNVTLGVKSVCQSNIRCKNLTIAGKLTGNIVCGEKVSLLASGQLIGDIQTEQLSIDNGAVFRGKCTMTAKKPEQTDVLQLEQEANTANSGA